MKEKKAHRDVGPKEAWAPNEPKHQMVDPPAPGQPTPGDPKQKPAEVPQTPREIPGPPPREIPPSPGPTEDDRERAQEPLSGRTF